MKKDNFEILEVDSTSFFLFERSENQGSRLVGSSYSSETRIKVLPRRFLIYEI